MDVLVAVMRVVDYTVKVPDVATLVNKLQDEAKVI